MPKSRVPPAVRVSATLIVAMLAACGGNPPGTAGQVDAGAGSLQTAPVPIRIVLAPDPVWEGMRDSGTVAAWETSGNVRIEASNPFDQFSAFAGGHADAVVINALEVAQLGEQSEREPVIIGKVTADRSFLAVNRTSSARGLDDLIEARIAVDRTLASTLLWGAIAHSLYGLDFRLDSADFSLVMVDATSVADLVMSGDVDACVCVPDFSVSSLSERRLKVLYGGRSAAEIYAEDVLRDPARRPVGDVLVVDRVWYAQNPEAVETLLGMWDEGLGAWRSDRAKYVHEYPHLLSIQTDEEIAWMTDYLRQHDWVSPSIYLTPDDRAGYSEILARLQGIGLLAEGVREPGMRVVDSTTASEG